MHISDYVLQCRIYCVERVGSNISSKVIFCNIFELDYLAAQKQYKIRAIVFYLRELSVGSLTAGKNKYTLYSQESLMETKLEKIPSSKKIISLLKLKTKVY